MPKINALFILILFATPALACHHEHSEHEEHEEHKAHVHGIADVMIALEGQKLTISFESPAANIIGFEHGAASEEEIRSVQAATTILNQPDKLFSFEGGECSLQQTSVNAESVSNLDPAITHRDLSANYQYTCQNSNALESIQLPVFEAFPGVEKLNAMWVLESHQGAKTLTKSTPSLRLNHE